MDARRLISFASAAAWCLAACFAVPAAAQESTAPVEGLRNNPSRRQAFVNARIVAAPDKVFSKATLLVEDGKVKAVGPEVAVPAGFAVYPMEGRTIYPGLFDAAFEPAASPDNVAEYGAFAKPAAGGKEAAAVPQPNAHNGTGHWNSLVRPDWSVAGAYRPDAAKDRVFRSQGVTLQLVCPAPRVVRGWSAIVSTAEGDLHRRLLAADVALHVQLHPPLTQGRADGYPGSPMGATALLRQLFLDGRWYAKTWEAFGRGVGPQPERNLGLEAVQPVLSRSKPVVFHSPDEHYALRAAALAKEADVKGVVRGSGREYRRSAEIEAAGLPVILPVRLPAPPDVHSDAVAKQTTLERLLHWDFAPENASRLAGKKTPILFGSHGLVESEKFLPNLRKMVARGLDPQIALAALTTAPAEQFGLAKQWGTLEPGKLAHLVVTDGDLFAEGTKVLETWIDGEAYRERSRFEQQLEASPWKLSAEPKDALPEFFFRVDADRAKPRLLWSWSEPPADAKKDAKPSKAAFVEALPQQLRFAAELAAPAAPAGVWRFDLLWNGDAVRGEAVTPEGKRIAVSAAQAPEEALPKTAFAPDADKKPDAAAAKLAAKASFPLRAPLSAFGLEKLPTGKPTLFRGAVLWTVAEGETAPAERDLLVVDGKIAKIGAKLEAPAGAEVVDLAGKHVAPGIIDCHSHSATDGGINEPSHSSTAEVRIGDFIDPDDVNIYRQLAGGVTTIHILHGSANTIGGQDAVVKLRWGGNYEALRFDGAPPGIKFALGENVKQSNWGDGFRSRYPQSRLGVEQFLRDRLQAAKEYAAARSAAAGPNDPLLRRSLELDALAEVLAGKRRLHCHCYRQDEILMLLKVCEDYGVKVATLQHVLEGYKVADAIARHGAGASAFSDWWAYKIEAYDAIPWNGAMLRRAGVVVSFNSDWNELARRMNIESTKAVRYGQVPEVDALAFVTLNPAKQLGIDRRVGSLEVGKDADFAVWSRSPLDPRTRCEQTWIDGVRRFSLAEDSELRSRAEREKAALVAKVLASGEEPGEEPLDEKTRWPRRDLFCTSSEGGMRE